MQSIFSINFRSDMLLHSSSCIFGQTNKSLLQHLRSRVIWVICVAGIPETKKGSISAQKINAWNTAWRDIFALNLPLFDY